jgi:hypothetical protein
MRYLIAVLWFFASAANAQFFSGNDLYPMCDKPGSVVSAFVAGVSDKAVVTYMGIDHVRKGVADPKFKSLPHRSEELELLASVRDMTKPYCTPRHATVGQLSEVFCKYLKENPAERANAAAVLASMAFAEAWPCEPKRQMK